MTVPEARDIMSGPLKFGDERILKAADLIERAERGKERLGPAICCTVCELDKPLTVHRIGCFLCVECTAKMDESIENNEAFRAAIGIEAPK